MDRDTNQKMTSKAGTTSFDVIDIQHSADVKSVYLMYEQKRQKIEITRVRIDFDSLPDVWIVPDGQLADIFGNSYHPCLCAIFRRLVCRCSDRTLLPLKNINLRELVYCFEYNQSVDDVIDLILQLKQIE